jgi:hypothetical protein
MSVRKVIDIIIGGRSELGGVVDKANAELGRLGKNVPGGGGGGGAGGTDGLLQSTSASLRSLTQMAKVLTTVEVGFRAVGAAAKALDVFSANSAGNIEQTVAALKSLEDEMDKIPVAGTAFRFGQQIRATFAEQEATELRWAERGAAESKADVDRIDREARDKAKREAWRRSIADPSEASIKRSRREIQLVGSSPQEREMQLLVNEKADRKAELEALFEKAENRRDFTLRDRVGEALRELDREFEWKTNELLIARAKGLSDTVNTIIDEIESGARADQAERIQAEVNGAVNLLIADIYGPAGGRKIPGRMGPMNATMLSANYRGVGELFSAGLDPQAAVAKSTENTARNTGEMAATLVDILAALRNGARMPAPFNLSLR